MTPRIPFDFEHPEIWWFSLHCSCGFETAEQSVGLIGRNESSIEHDSYRAAWFSDTTKNLHCDDFRAPMDLDGSSFRGWVQQQVVNPIETAYGNCFYLVGESASCKITCPECRSEMLEQRGQLECHRYVNIDPGDFTVVDNPTDK